MSSLPCSMRIIVAQLKLVAGDLARNTQLILNAIQRARDDFGGDLILFPELALIGCLPPARRQGTDIRAAIRQAFEAVCQHVHGIGVVLGHPEDQSDSLFNAASLIVEAKPVVTCRRPLIHGVRHEVSRGFMVEAQSQVVDFRGMGLGLLVGEEACHDPEPIAMAKAQGAQLILALSASPFSIDGPTARRAMLRQRVEEVGLPLISACPVGGQKALVFDGGSLAIAADGRICVEAPAFQEALLPVVLDTSHIPRPLPQALSAPLSDESLLWRALVCALQDYAHQYGFKRALLGVSGGIDSALVLALAVEAFGPDKVQATLLPSRYTTPLSTALAKEVCERLKAPYAVYSIEPAFRGALSALGYNPDNPPAGLMTENLQARSRCALLMAISNQSGALLLNTTNKSELSVGYGTLYGDLAGGFAPIKDIYKTQVYQLAVYRNTWHAGTTLFSKNLLTRPPTAELSFNQQDTDLLPPYATLDGILRAYLDQGRTLEAITAMGFEAGTVRQVLGWVEAGAFKRHQAPIGPYISRHSLENEQLLPLN